MSHPLARSQWRSSLLLFGFHLYEFSPPAGRIGFRTVNCIHRFGPAQTLFHQSHQDPQQKHHRADTQY
jgi:hypothetical protein